MNYGRFKKAFIITIPVLLGYIFLGIAFGILMADANYSVLQAFLSSICIYTGALQFLSVSLLSTNASLVTTFLMAVLLNSRHLFYGLSFIERFRAMALKHRFYLIYSLSDETYALLCSLKQDKDYHDDRLLVLVSFLDQSYWVIGTIIGAIFKSIFDFNTTGIDFAISALFICICLDQYLNSDQHQFTYLGFIVSIICLLIFRSNFILPSIIIIVMFMLFKKEH